MRSGLHHSSGLASRRRRRETALRAAAASLALAGAAATAAAADPEDAASDLHSLERVLSEPVYGDGRAAGPSKHEQDLERAPAAVVIRTGGEIRAQGYRTLAEVLDSMPGLTMQYDRAYVYGGVRGINRPGDFTSRLLVLVDGARINDPLYEGAPIGREFPIDINMIDRVEFVPGAGSALYGSSAVLGIVNVITRTAAQLPGWTSTGEVGTWLNRKVGVSWAGDLSGARVLAGLSTERRPGRDLYFAEFDTPQDNHGVARNGDVETTNRAFLKTRLSGVTVVAGLSERDKHIPTASYGAVFDTANVWTDRYAFLSANHTRQLDRDQELQLRMGIEQYQFRSTSVYGPREAASSGAESDDARAWSGEARYTWAGWDRHRLSAGVEFQRNDRQSIVLRTLDPNPETLTDFSVRSARHAVYLADEWQVSPSWLVGLGARSDWRLDGHSTTSPRWSAIWTPSPQWTFKWLQGSAFREPNTYERLYADGTQRPNPQLKVETLGSREFAGIWRATPSLTLESSIYSYRIRDLIELMTDADGINVFGNRGGAKSHGIDLTGTYVWPAGSQLRLSWSHQSARDTDTGARLSGSPSDLLKFSCMAPGPVSGMTLGINGRWVSRRLTRDGQSLAGYGTMNLNVSYAPQGRPWSLAVGIYNVTGERHLDPVGPEHVQQAIEQDVREIRLKATRTF